MDELLRCRITTALDALPAEHWHTGSESKRFNQPIALLEHLESREVTTLAELWQSVQKRYRGLKKDSAKSASVAKVAFKEVMFRLGKLRVDGFPGLGGGDGIVPVRELNQLMDLIGVAILHCPLDQTSTLAKYYSLRSELLSVLAEPELALSAIDHAIRLDDQDSSGGAQVMYKVSKARLLAQLDRLEEAKQMIAQAELDYSYPRVVEDSWLLAQYAADLELIYGVRDKIQQQLDDISQDNCKDIQEEEEEEEEFSVDQKPNFTYDLLRLTFARQAFRKGDRAVFALKSIPQDHLLLEEKVYSVVLTKAELRNRCGHCYKVVSQCFWPCVRCTEQIYCDPECARSDWSRSHQFECGLLHFWTTRSGSQSHVFKLMARLGVDQVLWTAGAEEKHCYPYDVLSYLYDQHQQVTPDREKSQRMVVDTFRAFQGLTSHSGEYPHSYLAYHLINSIDCAMMGCLAQGYQFDKNLTRKDLLILIEHCFTCVRKVLVNSFNWSQFNDQCDRANVGSCVGLIGTMFNHSCQPNASWEIRDSVLLVTANRPIEPGEEITISYGPSNARATISERQTHLLKHYFFLCSCSKCMVDAKSVLALQCPDCPGPVPVYDQIRDCNNGGGPQLNAICLLCGDQVPKTAPLVSKLIFAKSEVHILSQILLSHNSDDYLIAQKYLNLLSGNLKKVVKLSYQQSDLLIEPIYEAVQLLSQYDEFKQDCVKYGAIVDRILPLGGPELIVLPGEKKPTTTLFGQTQFDLNLDHLLFWNELYQGWLKTASFFLKGNNASAAPIWPQAIRFQHRLVQLLEYKIEELKSRKNDYHSFKNLNFDQQLNLLEQLKAQKQTEWTEFSAEFEENILGDI